MPEEGRIIDASPSLSSYPSPSPAGARRAAAAGGCTHYTGVCIGTATIWCERMPDYRRGGHRQASNAPLLGHGAFRQIRSHERARGQLMARVGFPVACARWSCMLEAVCMREKESPSSSAELSRSQQLG